MLPIVWNTAVMRGLAMAVILGLVGVACATSDDDVAELETTKEGVGPAELPETFEDEQGRTWVRIGPTEFDDSPIRPPSGRKPDIDIATMTLEEATEALRPISQFGSYDYTLAEDDARELASFIQTIAIEEKRADKGPRTLALADAGDDGDTQELVEKKIYGSDGRVEITNRGSWPWRAVGRMHGAGSCSSFKLVNKHTAVTAAHCVHTGSSFKTRKSITFGGRSSIGSSCYGMTVPGCWDGDTVSCDYAVIRLRAADGFCDESRYDVGNFGARSVGSWVSNINGQITGYPTEDLKSGWTVPVLATHWLSNNGWTVFTYPDRLFYTNDSSGGQSGGPYWATWDGSHQVMGIHTGWHSGFIYDTNQARKMTSSLFSWLQSNGGS